MYHVIRTYAGAPDDYTDPGHVVQTFDFACDAAGFILDRVRYHQFNQCPTVPVVIPDTFGLMAKWIDTTPGHSVNNYFAQTLYIDKCRGGFCEYGLCDQNT